MQSALYKQALFSFPSLSFFATAELYLFMFEFSIVTVNHVKELGLFINLWFLSNALEHWSDKKRELTNISQEHYSIPQIEDILGPGLATNVILLCLPFLKKWFASQVTPHT